MSSTTASAVQTLPDGGSSNTSYAHVKGRTSGGSDGYANVECFSSVTDGGVLEKDQAHGTIKSDVSSGLRVYIATNAYYSTTNGTAVASNDGSSLQIGLYGFTVTAIAGNRYLHQARSGYSVTTDTRGSWSCGTTLNV